MINKSIRPTRDDIAGIQQIIASDPRVEKSASEAIRYAVKDAAAEVPDWQSVRQLRFDDADVDESTYGSTLSFSLNEDDFQIVVDSLKGQLGIEKVRVSYLIRLCILAARERLRAEGKVKSDADAVVDVQNIDAMELLQKVNNRAAQLILAGSIKKVLDFIE